MNTLPVYWRNHQIGTLNVYEISDWKGQTPPGESDFESIYIYQSIITLHNILAIFKTYPDQDYSTDVPWMETVVDRISAVLNKENNRVFKEKVVKAYLNKFGMNQILSQYEVDTADLMTSLNRMIKNP